MQSAMFPVVDTRNPVVWTQASFEEVGLQNLVTAVTGNTPAVRWSMRWSWLALMAFLIWR